MFWWKHYKLLFSADPSFPKTQLVKPTFHPSKKYPLKKVSFLALGNFRRNHCFLVFPGFGSFGPPKNLGPKQIVCTNMLFLSPFQTQLVFGIFQKFLIFLIFWWPPSKHYFIVFFYTNFKVKSWSKSKLKMGPRMLRNKNGPVLTLKIVFLL